MRNYHTLIQTVGSVCMHVYVCRVVCEGLVWFECEGWLVRKFSDSYSSSIRGTPSRVLLCRVVCLQKLHVPVPLIFKSGSLCLVCLCTLGSWFFMFGDLRLNEESRPNPSDGVSACWSMPLSWVIQWSVLDLCFGRLPRGVSLLHILHTLC